jgi:hypothetical protein
MDNPYQPPSADLSPFETKPRRILHSVVALVSGLVIPPAIVVITMKLLFPDWALGHVNSSFWGSVLLGSLLAAAAVFRHKRIPLWLTAIIGPAIVFLMLTVLLIWQQP